MEVLLQEAREAYDQEIVVELRSDKGEDVDGNVERVVQWVEQWKRDNPGGVEGRADEEEEDEEDAD